MVISPSIVFISLWESKILIVINIRLIVQPQLHLNDNLAEYKFSVQYGKLDRKLILIIKKCVAGKD